MGPGHWRRLCSFSLLCSLWRFSLFSLCFLSFLGLASGTACGDPPTNQAIERLDGMKYGTVTRADQRIGVEINFQISLSM